MKTKILFSADTDSCAQNKTQINSAVKNRQKYVNRQEIAPSLKCKSVNRQNYSKTNKIWAIIKMQKHVLKPAMETRKIDVIKATRDLGGFKS